MQIFTEIRQYKYCSHSIVFFIPLSYSAPPFPLFPLEFRGEVNPFVTGTFAAKGSQTIAPY